MRDHTGGPTGATLTLREIASLVGGRVEGEATFRVSGVRPIDEAEADELGFLAAKRYVRFAATSRAGAVLVSEEFVDTVPAGVPRVIVSNAHGVLPVLLARLHPPDRRPASGVHPTAVIGNGVRLGRDVTVGAYAVLADGVSVGEGSRVDAHVVLGEAVRVGAGCHIHPHVVVYSGTSLGARVIVHAGACLGSDGFGYHFAEGAHRKVPQVGGCVIGDDVEIGANTTIDRGSIGDTVLGAGVKVDNLVQIAHNVKIGPHSQLAALVGIAGSTRIGSGVWFGGQAGSIGHLDIGDRARIAVATGVFRDVKAGETVSGTPARPHREELRRQAQVNRMGKLVERIEALEAEVQRLVEGGAGSGAGEEGSPK
ncbi:MAG: UDP-3-O-(3-hydroxymyristoyl)glucosamine N-acyltransferase [Gemmatimonadota bacterium]